MGKIANALEKAGIGTIGHGSASDLGEQERERGPQGEDGGGAANHRSKAPIRHPQAGAWDERLSTVLGLSPEAAESFRVLRSRILFPDDDAKICRTIMVISTAPKEGKSFVAANLGIALAKGVDQRSLLVDCDLRRPTLARLFGLPGDRGLADYLRRGTDLAELIQKTSVEKLTVLASGTPPANPAELLGSAKMHELVRELSERYDDRFIIFDSPPILAASEALVLSQKVDGVVLVVRHGASNRTQVKKIVELIGKERIIGAVFNGYESNSLEARVLGRYSYYGSYYGEAGKKGKRH